MVEHAQPIPDGVVTAPGRTFEAATSRWARITAWALREALLFPVVALFIIAIVISLPDELHSDSWFAIFGGHEVAHNGLPLRDSLTIWTHGQQWVDQQWIGQLVFYGMYAVAGVKLALFGHAVATSSAFVGAIVFARRRGASVRSICWLTLPTLFLLIWGSWNARAQSLAFGLFVAVVWLLVVDSRAPSRRVFLALPLLVLWANVHGSAVTGALLVVVAGLTYAFERRRELRREWLPRAALLCTAPIACLFVSPYALSLPGYYHSVLFNSAFRDYVIEWRPTTPDFQTSPFYLLAFLAVWLIGRHGDRLSRFEQALLLATLLLGLQSMRGVIWFALVAAMVMPAALDGLLRQNHAAERFASLNRALIAVSLAGVLTAVVAVAVKPAEWFERDYPNAILTAVQRAETANPRVRVFANEQYSDWLLLRRPELRGRLAFDIRFELFSRKQIEGLVALRRQVKGSQRIVAPYALFVLKKGTDTLLANGLLREAGSRELYRGAGAIVIFRAPEQSRTG
jgi:hypothetical protein